MKVFHEGQLVQLVENGSELDGIVVRTQSLVKIEVAVADAEHGAVFHTVHPKVLRERDAVSEHDDELRRRIRRTSGAGHGGPRSGPGGGRRGHSSVSGHRTTGK